MFQFPGFAYWSLSISALRRMGCPIRISTDQRLFAPPRGLSQLITSFVALESLGIPHTLLVTFFFLIPRFFFFSILWFDSIFPACQRTYAFITDNTVTSAWWYPGNRTPFPAPAVPIVILLFLNELFFPVFCSAPGALLFFSLRFVLSAPLFPVFRLRPCVFLTFYFYFLLFTFAFFFCGE